MKRFGLIGHPIARSLSPGLFKAAYGGKYPYDLIQGEDFEESYDYNQDISIEEKLVIREFMKILSEEEREIVYLHTIAGFKFREIAHICNLALPTVLSKYHRALKKLRKE